MSAPNLFQTHPLGIVVSRFNHEITGRLYQDTMRHLLAVGVSEEQVLVRQVPGAFEIPLAAQQLFQAHDVAGVIALGAVIRGETSHYDLICQTVAQGCMQVGLAFNKPLVFGVLTTENEQQAWDRIGGPMGDKAQEFVEAILSGCSLSFP